MWSARNPRRLARVFDIMPAAAGRKVFTSDGCSLMRCRYFISCQPMLIGRLYVVRKEPLCRPGWIFDVRSAVDGRQELSAGELLSGVPSWKRHSLLRHLALHSVPASSSKYPPCCFVEASKSPQCYCVEPESLRSVAASSPKVSAVLLR